MLEKSKRKSGHALRGSRAFMANGPGKPRAHCDWSQLREVWVVLAWLKDPDLGWLL